LSRWSIGRAGRFAICYVRNTDIRDLLEIDVELGGQRLSLRFVSRAERVRRGRTMGVFTAAAVVVMMSLAGAVATAISVRTETEGKLAAVEQSASAQLREARRQRRLKAQSLVLDAAGARGRQLSDVLRDLNWASNAKAAGAHIDAIHWQQGYLGVEVRGDTPPFSKSDREITRSKKPLRPGVWLWGVGPASRVR
jgi:hypothetical protein